MSAADPDRLLKTLVSLVEQARRRETPETTDSWLLAPGRSQVAQVVEQLKTDKRIKRYSQPNMMLFVLPTGGAGYMLEQWLAGFLERALMPGTEPTAEARRFLDFLTVRDDEVEVTTSVTLVGLSLVDDQTVDTALGRLRPADDRDFFLLPEVVPPPAAVLDYETRLPAQVAPYDRHPFTTPSSTQRRAEVQQRLDEHVSRLLVALVLLGDGPVQEHVTFHFPRYTRSGSALAPPKAGPIVVGGAFAIAAGEQTQRLIEAADLAARVDVARLGVAARRLLVAFTERVRPEDQILDYAIALDSITRIVRSLERGEALAALLATSAQHNDAVLAAHRRLTAARNQIVHEGRPPADAPDVATVGRSLVRAALDAHVRRVR